MKSLEDLNKSLRLSRALRSLNVLRVASAVIAGQTLTFGALTMECTIGTTVTTPGNIPVDVSAAASLIAASGTLTSDNTNVADGETVTIGSTVYRFKDTMLAAYDVQIGADADASLLNLIKAINASGTAGTHYFAGTLIHPTVSAATSVTAHAFAVTAKTKGTVGNSIASTETSGHLSWGAATLANGADTSASDFTTAVATAAGTLQTLAQVTRIGANELLFVAADSRYFEAKSCTETLAGSNNAWHSATSFGGAAAPDSFPDSAVVSRAAIAGEVTLNNMHFYLGFAPAAFIVQIRRSGVLVQHGGTVTVTGNRLTITNTGSTDFAAGDVVSVFASA